MIIPPEVKCKFCGKIFCCSKCREKHETNVHPVEVAKDIQDKIDAIECPICRYEPFILQSNISDKLLSHISQQHLPLHCTKCHKIYSTKIDLLEFSKCSTINLKCKLQAEIIICRDQPENQTKINVQHSTTTSTQTSPYLEKSTTEANESAITPISVYNLQWKAKHIGCAGDGSLTDSVSSINASTNKDKNGKTIGGVVRTTSTPMQTILLKMKSKNDSSSCHVSSIHSSASESEVTPPVDNANSSSSHFTKPDGTMAKSRVRSKMPVAATPLRQVMSKSIQRAIAEHRAGHYRDKGIQPKKIFDSLDASCSIGSPIDLRTSPVLRRTQSEIIDRTSSYEEFHLSKTSSKKAIFSSTKHVITEDVIITSLSSKYEKLETVYETCRSIQTSLYNATPKLSGSNSTNLESYKTPYVTSSTEENDDVFYTPKTSSLSQNIKNKNFKEALPEENNNYEKIEEKENRNKNEKIGGKLWSLVTSVMRLASFGSSRDVQETEKATEIKRCASFAGTVTKANSIVDQSPTSKRKRTNTVDSQFVMHLGSQGPSKRLKRITGRKPIERMRKQSETD